MNRSSPGLLQWITVSLLVAVSLFLLLKLYQFAGFRSNLPAGLKIAGIDVGSMTHDEASLLLTNRYLEAPVTIFYGNDDFEISPAQAEFTLDLQTMLNEADYQRVQQDFWAGFWGFLWGRPIEVASVPLTATHNREALRDTLEILTELMDQPAQPPQPIPSSLSFQHGLPGIETNIEASFADIEAALYRPGLREAHLVLEPTSPKRPDINLLTRLLVNHLQDFEQLTGGVASVFIMDLHTGEELTINPNLAMSGMSLLKIPIVLESFRVLEHAPTLAQSQLISETLVIRPDNFSANALLNLIAGQDDPHLGAQLVTESLQRLGLQNTFMITPFDEDRRPGQLLLETPANSIEPLPTNPSPTIQTTAEDMGTLLSMIYYCAQGQGGALTALWGEQITQTECREQLNYMKLNVIGSLIEEGVPTEISVAHRHGWISDTHGDAGIVYSPAGDYVIVMFLYKRDWLEWELSSPLLADISRAAYNYFNFDDPYLTDSRAN